MKNKASYKDTGGVNYHKMLRELVDERNDIDQAIRAIEPLARRRQKRRGPGRPPLLFSFKRSGSIRRGPGRPPGSGKRGPGRPPKKTPMPGGTGGS